ncbi:hypothetical protein Leryth_007554 [Lithospermum erythrorhizon]|nr:hypothetical protein Leryth_007554 [Lithospermum erythrorhizon]
MEEVAGTKTWRAELASLVEDSQIRFNDDVVQVSAPAKESHFVDGVESELVKESLKEQMKGFVMAWGELGLELGKGVKDVLQQSLFTEDSFLMKKTRGPLKVISERLRFFNDYLPEDRDPMLAWSVIIFVFIIALAVMNVNSTQNSSATLVKKVQIPPAIAIRILLPDGRYMAYHELGVSADRARFSVIAPHGFLSSRLGGLASIKEPLLEEFGVRLVTYDLPGFGESDPHLDRNLSSSALDMLHLADAVGINDKFWVWGFSSGAIHAWSALKHIPDRIAGASMFAPLVNPYDSSMTKEEISTTWELWTGRRKLMFYLARRFPSFLGYFYSRTFLSGKHGQIDNWLSLTLGEKDVSLVKQPAFEEFWHRDVEESIRQASAWPFIQEAVLQVSNWGFNLVDLQVQKKCPGRGIFSWPSFMYRSQAECVVTGYLGPIHIWQGTDDHVIPPSMTDFVARVLPEATVHKLPEEGHFSYFFLCDECQRQILSTLFGSPLGPLDLTDETSTEETDSEKEADKLTT